MTAPAFRRGAEALQEASKGTSFARTQYFGIEDGKKAIIRLLTEYTSPDPNVSVWIAVDQHAMIPTKPKPEGWGDKNWPEKMGAVCRRDPAFAGMYGDCYICDFLVGELMVMGKKLKKPSGRGWALACLREEVIEGGQVVGIQDVKRDVTLPAKDGQPEKTIKEKAIVVVNMGYKNFFGTLKGFGAHYGTVLDRDYAVAREGASTDTDYHIVPLDPILKKDGSKFDLKNPEDAARYETDLDLGEIVGERASDTFYARFFDPRVTVGEDDKVVPTGATPEPKPSNDVDQEKVQALASRIKGYGPGQDEGAPAPAPAPAAAPASGAAMQDFN